MTNSEIHQPFNNLHPDTTNEEDKKRLLNREYSRRYRQKQHYNNGYYFEREKEIRKRYRYKVGQNPEMQEKEREMLRKRRSEDPTFLEKERERWKRRSADPTFKEKEKERIKRFRVIKAVKKETGWSIESRLL